MASPAPSAAQVAAETAAQAVKVAQELKARLDRAPRAADPDLVKAAATALVDYRWAQTADADKVAAALLDPNAALRALAEVATKAAEEIARLQGGANGRLAAGQILGEPTKRASDGMFERAVEPESDADVRWAQKMAAYRAAGTV